MSLKSTGPTYTDEAWDYMMDFEEDSFTVEVDNENLWD